MKRQVITGSSTPAPLAHYSQGVMVGDTLYAAGQIASDYKSGVPPEARQDPAFLYYGSDIQKQARYYFDQVWKEFFPSPPPRTTVQVSGLLVPGCKVEIDLTAVLP